MKVDVIIYSKNRALQLDMLLRSINKYFVNVGKVFVLNDFSGEKHYKSYQKIWNKNYGLDIEFITQTRKTFYDVMIGVVDKINADYILPFCDDDLFIRETDIKDKVKQLNDDIVGLCFRRCPTLGNSYHTGKPIPVPNFTKTDGVYKWKWVGAFPSRWGYPYQAGGMVYDTKFFKHIMHNIKFDLPNYLESQMMQNKEKWGRNHVMCLEKTPIVNVSVNRVQNEVKNRGGRDVNYSVDDLVDIFLNGKVVSIDDLHNYNNNCEFIEVPLNFVEE